MPRIYLHIGAMKTGTKHLQNLMEANAESLAGAGYLFPGEHGWSDQVFATREILRMTGDDRVRRRAKGMWERVAGQMLEYDGQASIFSMEFLSFAKRPGVRRITDSLESAELHVVLTVRDALRVIPAQWQTSARNGHTASWPEFAAQVMANPPDPDSTGHKVFQRAQNVAGILDAWLRVIPPERFHIVTVPPPGSPRTLLWERFASAVGVDPAVCDRPPPTSNESIGQASAGLVRLLNLELGKLTLSDYRSIIKTELAAKALSERANVEQRADTNPDLRAFAARTNAANREAIVAAGVDVVGDLEDLPCEPATGPDDGALRAPTPREYLETAAFAIPRMHQVVQRRARKLRRLEVEIEDALVDLPPGPAGEPPATRWDAEADPVQAAVRELAAVVRVAIELQRRIYAKQDESAGPATHSVEGGAVARSRPDATERIGDGPI